MVAMGPSILSFWLLAILVVFCRAHDWNEEDPQTCGRLRTRKEWRTLTQDEKAQWVGAVKVCPSVGNAPSASDDGSVWPTSGTSGSP